jgi:hypothetical protein
MSLDELRRLSDEGRAALDDRYVAINGVPSDSPIFVCWRNQVLADSVRAWLQKAMPGGEVCRLGRERVP